MEKLRILFFYSVVMLFCLSTMVSAKEHLLILRSEGANFEDAINGMRFDLEYDFEMHDLILEKELKMVGIDKKLEALHQKIIELKPKVVVLMNNKAISLYKKYQKEVSAKVAPIPSVSLMGILVESSIKDMKNATGIGYEIPIVTSTVNYRTILNKPIKKVGIVHRKIFSNFIAQNSTFCKREGIELVTVQLDRKDISSLKKSLETLVKREKVDAIWIPNDNVLLKKMKVWQDFAKKFKLPIIVGVQPLVTSRFSIGSYAVLPDNVALGSQAASVVFDIMDNNWKVPQDGFVQPPLSVFTIINYPLVNKYFKLEREDLSSVDRILD